MTSPQETRRGIPPDAFVVATKFTVSREDLPRVVERSLAIHQSAKVAPGYLNGELHLPPVNPDGSVTLFTVTAWQGREDMTRFKDSEPHREAMINVNEYGRDFDSRQITNLQRALPSQETIIAIFEEPRRTS